MKESRQYLIDRIRKDIDSRNQVIKEIYTNRKIKDSIYSFILKNGGDKDDAQDMFTHAVVSFIQQCYSPVFELKHSLNTYLYSIARHAWINKRKEDKKFEFQNHKIEFIEYEPSMEEKIIGNERLQQLRKGLSKIGENCKNVMLLWASQIKMREIAIRMNYASEEVARKKKHQCLQKLKSILKDI